MSTQDEIDALTAQIQPLAQELERLVQKKRSEDSLEFIRVNRITKDDVWTREAQGTPFFNTVWQFANYLKTKTEQRRFTEWNDIIYFTSDLMAGRMPDMPATTSDLPK